MLNASDSDVWMPRDKVSIVYASKITRYTNFEHWNMYFITPFLLAIIFGGSLKWS